MGHRPAACILGAIRNAVSDSAVVDMLMLHVLNQNMKFEKHELRAESAVGEHCEQAAYHTGLRMIFHECGLCVYV